MKLGSDVSIAECRVSGYMVIEYKKRDLIKKGILDKDCRVSLTVSNPDAWTDCGRRIPPVNNIYDYEANHGIPPVRAYILDDEYSWNDLMKFLNDFDRRKSVESCCDWKHCKPNLDNPDEYDFLRLASDIQFCYSLATY